jgi:thiamine kinase-like enzyme
MVTLISGVSVSKAMASPKSDIKSEIKSWLKVALKKENLTDIVVNEVGTTEKGDGYMGDIIFASVSGKTEGQSTKDFDLVLKCSKQSQALRENPQMILIYLNEILMYDHVFPTFLKFQQDKGIKDPFNSVPKCYGTFKGENIEVIVLENLKKNGYELWPKKKPLERKHIDFVIKQYGKFHAISAAMREQQPDKFEELVKRIEENMKGMAAGPMVSLFGGCIDETCELLKNELDENILSKWRSFKDQIETVVGTTYSEGFKVIIHGDCWNNNFMHKFENETTKEPLKVAMLDWQVSRYASPIADLSYFLFTCISKEDIENLDEILSTYYSSFTNYLRNLGVEDPDVLYPFHQFLDEWKLYCKYGILMSSFLMKICSTEKDEVVDITESVDSGKDFFDTFSGGIRNTELYKKRMRHIIEYAVKHDLI